MSIWGKLIGGAAGLAIGGPIGALVGLSVGAAVDAGIERALVRDDEATRKLAFTIGVIALAAKMAKADGRVTREEVDAFKAVFRVPPDEMTNVGRVFDMARQHTAGYEAYARQLAGLLKDNRTVKADLLEALFFIAKADGEIHPREIDYLRDVARIFGWDDAAFAALRSRHMAPDPDCPYTILGVPHDIGMDALRRRYRTLVRETHPDRLIAEGVPADLIAVATRRAAEINAAYDRIMVERGASPNTR